MPNAQKEAAIQSLADEFESAKSLVFADYRGLDVAQISELRRLCRENGVKFKVAKNTLTLRALDQAGWPRAEELLAGPTGLAVAREDEIAAARVLSDFAKEHELLEVKGGIMEGRVLSFEEVSALATLPSKDELIAGILGGFDGVVSLIVGAADSLVSDVLSCAEQAAEANPAAEAPAAEAPTAEAPAEEAPVEEAPVEEAPVEDAPAGDAAGDAAS